jgi:metal-responsive CopG/Arc/MetJ family transcriptional regulator
MKLSISMSDDLLEEVDSMAKSLSLSRSSYIAFACSQHIKQEKLVSQIPDLFKAVSELKQTVEIADSKALLKGKK